MPKRSRSNNHIGNARSSATAGVGAPYQLNQRPSSTPAASFRQTPASNNLVAPNTGLGQHFLKNPAIVTAIINKAGIQPSDIVLEIGPGTGNMTMQLLGQGNSTCQCQQVNALEYDVRMIREIMKRTESLPSSVKSKLQIIQGDAIKTAWPFFNVMVANLPYQISSPVVFKLLAHRPMFRVAVLMFQEEFALRLTAKPGEALYCRLSVNTQLLARVDQLLKVGRNNFRPPPKVESRVVRITLKNPVPPINFVEWDGMIRLLFNRKNKTLRAVLTTKSVLQLLDANRRTILSLKNSKGTSGKLVPKKQAQDEEISFRDLAGDAEDMDASDDQSDDDPEVDGKGRSDNEILRIVEEICARDAWKNQRASKMSLDDFLQLLTEFHQAGIHFSV
jgi:18S rRNA (adenine1779-N6/adenine1780-N6)-dimethyltransferase